MSIYALQKTIREINRNNETRQRFLATPQEALMGAELTGEERDALIARDYRALYRLGVHGLILRPFSIINGVSEADYLSAICEEP
jgi:Aromatic-ring-opening dioxygenase LigAB, LigA subunit